VKSRLLLMAWLSTVSNAALAQAPSDDIVVTAPRGEHRVTTPSLVLDGEALDEQAPVAVADLFRAVPGVQMRVNSRGEAVVRVRGSEERQTSIFLDGAPLVTPWDGRVDLALLPAGLIQQVSVVKGAAPLEYGANAASGVIDLNTVLAGNHFSVRGEGQAGTGGIGSASAVISAPLWGGLSFSAAGAIISRDGERIADKSVVPFDPASGRLRTNTDLDGTSSFAAIGYDGGDNGIRLSWLHTDLERGIAAQGDLDPAISSPRYWRYPRWSFDQLTLIGRVRLGGALALRVTGWQQWFGQTIHAYQDSNYTTLRSREKGDDQTSGLRATLTRDWGDTLVRLSTAAQTSTHDQRDAATSTGLESGFVDGPTLHYRQRLYSLGMETDRKLADGLDATLGIGIDRAETPLTGDKPAQRPSEAMSFYGALRYVPSNTLRLMASLGRRSRFPSPRELFGEALGRFLANPDLAPERALMGDLSAQWQVSQATNLEATWWFSDNDGTISQRVVQAGAVKRRQRYNMAGSFANGLEASINTRLSPGLTFELGGAVQRGRARREADGSRALLLQRPGHQLTAALDWSPVSDLDLRAEVTKGGSAHDLADSGAVIKLPGYTSVNLRAFATVGRIGALGPLALFVIADNLGDALIVPQLGLPVPGRTLRVGIRIGGRQN
jgi:iron complex outermembrane receptor protein